MVFGVLRAWWGDGFGFRILECLWGAGGGGRWVGEGTRGGWRGGCERKRVTMKQTPEKLWMMVGVSMPEMRLRSSTHGNEPEKRPFPNACMHARSLS